INFLLPSGNVSRFHRIPMAETWRFYTVPPNVWLIWFLSNKGLQHFTRWGIAQSCSKECRDSHYSLVGCTCAPAFQFQDFELAKTLRPCFSLS
ncbi:uncharacterized protein LOC126633916, partial [Malus sylvestris]|uniref:uncharacterized protein LOC126633916 n=1 Tax=Malus sylvestris TaxID=3752 RepID=UPI0021AD2CE5